MPEKELNNKDPLDFQFGQSQEQIEELRSEFVSLGGLVSVLPEVSSVRDWTMVGIPSIDSGGEKIISLWLMMNGEWYSLNSYRLTPTGASGNINMLNVAGIYTVPIADTRYEFTTVRATGGTDHWELTDKNNINYSDGVFTIIRAGRYHIAWSVSFTCGTNNREYEMGVMLNGVQTYGWAHRKIGTSGDVGSMSAQTILDLKKGDKISLGYLCIANTTTLTASHANLTLNRIR